VYKLREQQYERSRFKNHVQITVLSQKKERSKIEPEGSDENEE